MDDDRRDASAAVWPRAGARPRSALVRPHGARARAGARLRPLAPVSASGLGRAAAGRGAGRGEIGGMRCGHGCRRGHASALGALGGVRLVRLAALSKPERRLAALRSHGSLLVFLPPSAHAPAGRARARHARHPGPQGRRGRRARGAGTHPPGHRRVAALWSRPGRCASQPDPSRPPRRPGRSARRCPGIHGNGLLTRPKCGQLE